MKSAGKLLLFVSYFIVSLIKVTSLHLYLFHNVAIATVIKQSQTSLAMHWYFLMFYSTQIGYYEL